MAQMDNKSLRVIAVAAKDRIPQMKDVPTTAEGGVAELVVQIWYGLVAPVQTPAHASQGNPARLLVVGSGKMFGIDQLRSIAPIQGGIPTNVQMLLNVFDWLSQDPDLLAVRAKDVSEPTLGDVSETKKNLFQWGSIFGLPLLVGLLGVFMARMRAQRRAELAASMGK